MASEQKDKVKIIFRLRTEKDSSLIVKKSIQVPCNYLERIPFFASRLRADWSTIGQADATQIEIDLQNVEVGLKYVITEQDVFSYFKAVKELVEANKADIEANKADIEANKADIEANKADSDQATFEVTIGALHLAEFLMDDEMIHRGKPPLESYEDYANLPTILLNELAIKYMEDMKAGWFRTPRCWCVSENCYWAGKLITTATGKSFITRMNSFRHQNPALAQLIWEQEAYRKDLLSPQFLDVSDKKRKAFMEAEFSQLGLLLSNKPRSSNSELNNILYSDPKLKKLYNEYNTEDALYDTYRRLRLGSTYCKDYDEKLAMLWGQINAREQELTIAYQRKKAKEVKKPIPKAEWF